MNSNNVAFEIFSYFKQPFAQTTLRALSRKGLEKSVFLYKYISKPAYFNEKLLNYSLIFDMKIGVILSKREF